MLTLIPEKIVKAGYFKDLKKEFHRLTFSPTRGKNISEKNNSLKLKIMRPTLTITLGLACLLDLGMMFFLEASVWVKIVMIPIIGSSFLISFIAGHYVKEFPIKACLAMAGILLLAVYPGIFNWLEAPITEKKMLFMFMSFFYQICFICGWGNEELNKKFQEKFSETDQY